MEEKIMRAHYLVSAATACLLLTSGLVYAQTPAETKKDEPRKERVEKDQPAKASDSRSEVRPQEKSRERGETAAPRQAGEEHGKPLNAAERNGAANPNEAKGARGETTKSNEHADETRHEGAAPSAHENRDERTKSSATPNAEKSAAEKASQDKSAEETRKSKSGATANENSKTQRDEAAKGSPAPSQQASPQDTKGAANDTGKAKGSNEAQRGANETQRGANNGAQPNSATAASSQLPRDKEVRISETLKQHELAPPERNLNISISVGVEVPERVRVHRLPPEIVSIAPEYRDYDYFSTDDDIVIVEPRTHRIVSQVPRDASRARAEVQGGATNSATAANVGGGVAGPCQIQKRDASGQLTEVAPTTVGSAQSRNSIAIVVQTPDQRSSSPIALDAAAGQIIVASQGPGDCRVTIEPEPAR
jgi:hypothetical protein